MKTISLDQEAYERLSAWKQPGRDSFSKVVKRMVPRKGSLASLAEMADANRAGSRVQDEALERAITDRSGPNRDPWME